MQLSWLGLRGNGQSQIQPVLNNAQFVLELLACGLGGHPGNEIKIWQVIQNDETQPWRAGFLIRLHHKKGEHD